MFSQKGICGSECLRLIQAAAPPILDWRLQNWVRLIERSARRRALRFAISRSPWACRRQPSSASSSPQRVSSSKKPNCFSSEAFTETMFIQKCRKSSS